MALIDIGSAKQLFVDDYLIESMTNTRQIMNPAEKAENNPVVRPEHPWEGNFVRVGNVFFDEKDQILKMWYGGQKCWARRVNGEIVVEEDTAVTCLATSEDGIHWQKPILGLVEYDGSTENNILPKSSLMPYWFLDHHETDPAKRYKGLIRTGDTMIRGMTFDLYYSPDAFHWTPYESNPVIDTSPQVGRWGPTLFTGWDPIRQVYTAHMENCWHRRTPLGRRLIGRAESPDMIHWTEPDTILVPDEQDPPDTEFYCMPVIVYEGLYVGLVWIFRTTNTTHHPEIVFSRDGIHYERNYRQPFIPRGATADFDHVSVYARTPVVHGDKILTYYSGRNWRSQEQLLALGDKALGAVGLAITPRDGFVSLDGGKGWVVHDPDEADTHKMGCTDYLVHISQGRASFSQMVTRTFSFSGERLHLNLSRALLGAGPGLCEVRVEVLSPNHSSLPGYGFKDADPITDSGHDRVVSWRGNPDVSGLAGQPIRLRFYFKNAKLYAFQFKS